MYMTFDIPFVSLDTNITCDVFYNEFLFNMKNIHTLNFISHWFSSDWYFYETNNDIISTKDRIYAVLFGSKSLNTYNTIFTTKKVFYFYKTPVILKPFKYVFKDNYSFIFNKSMLRQYYTKPQNNLLLNNHTNIHWFIVSLIPVILSFLLLVISSIEWFIKYIVFNISSAYNRLQSIPSGASTKTDKSRRAAENYRSKSSISNTASFSGSTGCAGGGGDDNNGGKKPNKSHYWIKGKVVLRKDIIKRLTRLYEHLQDIRLFHQSFMHLNNESVLTLIRDMQDTEPLVRIFYPEDTQRYVIIMNSLIVQQGLNAQLDSNIFEGNMPVQGIPDSGMGQNVPLTTLTAPSGDNIQVPQFNDDADILESLQRYENYENTTWDVQAQEMAEFIHNIDPSYDDGGDSDDNRRRAFRRFGLDFDDINNNINHF